LSRAKGKLFTLLGFAAFAGLIVWIAMPPSHSWKGPLRDADVKTLYVDCGTADEPLGTGMPACPDGQQRFYTRQRWTEANELKVEVWEFLSPGHALVSAGREAQGRRLAIKPRWEVPPGGAVAAC
jgi:hypothetical protein